MFCRSEEENAYMASCEKYDLEMPYEEYVVHVYRCLLISDWHYKPESALRIIRDEAYWIKKLYEQKKSPAAAMTEIGFGCG